MASFLVPDMSCDACVRAVTASVHRLDPSARVNVDLATKLVEVSTAQPDDAVAAGIRSAGFTVA